MMAAEFCMQVVQEEALKISHSIWLDMVHAVHTEQTNSHSRPVPGFLVLPDSTGIRTEILVFI